MVNEKGVVGLFDSLFGLFLENHAAAIFAHENLASWSLIAIHFKLDLALIVRKRRGWSDGEMGVRCDRRRILNAGNVGSGSNGRVNWIYDMGHGWI